MRVQIDEKKNTKFAEKNRFLFYSNKRERKNRNIRQKHLLDNAQLIASTRTIAIRLF